MKNKSGYIYILIGALFIVAAAILLRHNLSESQAAGDESEKMLEELMEQMPDQVLDAESGDMPVVDVDGHSFIGTLEIPSLGLLLPIQNEWSKANAKYAICRYKGSVYENNLIICGHNYPEHFGNINELSTGDNVVVTDMNGKSFYFQVSNIETLGAKDVIKMDSGDWDLTLFTCTIGGANRVTIRCEATGEISESGTVPDVIDAAEKSKHIRQ